MKKDTNDIKHTAIKAGLNLIPGFGGALSVIFESVFSSPIDKRKEKWLSELAKTVDELLLKVNDLTPEKLSKNEMFISAFLQASNIAIRTHHKEKLQALKCAVKNSLLRDDLDENKKMIFIQIIDDLTPLHFKVLDFLSTPETYIEKLDEENGPNTTVNWGAISNIWDESFNDISSNNELIKIITADLYRFGFIYIDEFYKANGRKPVIWTAEYLV